MLDGIETGSRLRPVNQAHVERLKASIAEIGLQTPITVMSVPDGVDTRMILVAGLHRLEALRGLGEEAADCFIIVDDAAAAELWEIDENFARAELTEAQRADHHARRKAIMEARGLVGTRGGDRKSKSQGETLKSYAEHASETLGVGQSTVLRDLHRARHITPEVLAEVTGTALDKGVVLDELAKVPAEVQRAKLAEITLRRSEAERTRKDAEAVNRNTDRVIALTEAEQFADWLHARADLNELPTIISWLEGTKAKDVIAALRRQA
ncbi:ParB N-terminal domain-containing protein [Paraburkholderia fungorum]|uniref:ParB N-terminal domain-containing protein n=1 Tax=Paraburkholderia fungorum TaxID=134537 RepID=UPI003D6BD741